MIPFPLPVRLGGAFTRPLRVCFAIPEFLDFPSRGGIGNAYAAFAEALARAGHDVTVLLTQTTQLEQSEIGDIEKGAKEMGIRLVLLPELTFRCHSSPGGGPHPKSAFRAWHWLKEQDFEVIHFTEWQTVGFYCVSAKRAGMAFHGTLLCVSLRSSSRWCREAGDLVITQFRELETDYLEQRTAELADVVFVPSHYAATWALAHGWKLPEPVYHQPNLIRLPHSLTSVRGQRAPVKEIVFFGRLQRRKGFLEFCAALELLEDEALSQLTITFLGARTPACESRLAFLEAKIGNLVCCVKILDTYSRDEALEYLLRPGVLAVIASHSETFGNAAYECQVLGIPFLAANTPGLCELISPEHRDALFELSPTALAARLTEALGDPPQILAPRYDPEVSKAQWIMWHNDLTANRCDFMPPTTNIKSEDLPLVTVCMAHYNQPELLLKAVASLEAQTYPNLEVLIVDDGSSLAGVPAILDAIEARIAPRSWKVIRQANAYVGAARNEAARHAKGEFLMFMDDDNIAKPHEVETFVRAALSSAHDVVVCMMECFGGNADPLVSGDPSQWVHIFLGGPTGAAVFQNTLGDANFFIRTNLFRSLGGFVETKGRTGEDANYLVRVGLAGHSILAVPEALYWYRIRPDSMYRTASQVARQALTLSAFHSAAPAMLWDAFEYARASHLNKGRSLKNANPLRSYETVVGSRASEIGVKFYFGSGWYPDERNLCWSGTKRCANLIFIARKTPSHINFSATLLAAKADDRLTVDWNGKTILKNFRGGRIELTGLSLSAGENQLTFTPALEPMQTSPNDTRVLSYAISQITVSPAPPETIEGVHFGLMQAPANINRTVTLNELSQSGATAAFGSGWHADEETRRWMGADGRRAAILFQSPITCKIRFCADLEWPSSAHALNILFNNQLIKTYISAGVLDLTFTLSAKTQHTLTLETALEPFQPSPHETRQLGCALTNIRIFVVH